MAIFQKNVYLLFWIVTLIGIIVMSVVFYDKWKSINNRYLTLQEKSVQRISNATHALFATQELMLDILGKEVLNNGDAKLLDEMINMDPSIAAFGLADIDGNLIKVSANLRGKNYQI